MKISLACLIATVLANDGHAAKPRVRVPGGKAMKGSCAGSASDEDDEGSAVYTMTNQPVNEIIAYSRSRESGLLAFESRVATGGAGGISNFTVTNDFVTNFQQPTQGDPLGSQDSIIVAGRCLLAVNAGSNNISTFRIVSSSEIQPKGTFPSGGIFPVSLTEKDGLVYVLNAGDLGSIQGFALTQFNCGLLAIQVPLSLNQNAVGSVPDFELASPAEIQFTPEGNILVVVKVAGGGQLFPAGPGSLNLFEIDPADGTASGPVTTDLALPGTIPFAVDFDSQGRLLLAEAVIAGIPVDAEAFPGGVTLWEYGGDGTYAQVATRSVDEPATCWTRYNPYNGCTYTANTSPDGSISSLRSTEDGLVLVDQRAAELFGPYDFSISRDGRYMYVLSSQLNVGGAGGDAQPRIHAYEMGCDCGLEEVQQITEGLDDQATRIANVGFFFGFQGLAVYN